MNQKINDNLEDEIDLAEIFNIFWNKKKVIFIITSVFAIFSIGFSLSLPNIYTSKSLLIPVSSKDNLTSQLSSYSSFANLAGINLPKENVSKSKEALERIKSFDFFSNHFLPNVKLENIMAVKDWIPYEDKIIYKESIYEDKSSKWVRKASFPKTSIPSDLEAYEEYKKLLSIYEDKQSSFITISINHQSPIIAKKWVNIIINNINESMREEDMTNALNSIDFLNKSSQSTNLQSTKDAIVVLLEDQLQTLMLSSSNKSYILKIIDSAYIPEKKSGPKRTYIVLFATLAGLFFSLIFAMILNSRNSLK